MAAAEMTGVAVTVGADVGWLEVARPGAPPLKGHLDSASEDARPTAGPAPLLERKGDQDRENESTGCLRELLPPR